MMEVRGEQDFDARTGAAKHPEAVAAPGTSQPAASSLSRKAAPPAVLFVVILLSFLAVGGVLAAGLLPRFTTEQELAVEQKAKAITPIVSVVLAKRAPAQSDLTLPANLQAVQEIPIYARCSGYLKERLVDIGDKVQKDQTLAVIDAPELDQQLEQAKADLQEAISQVKSSEADLARAQATLMTTKANLKKMEANLVFSKREIGRYIELESQGAISREQRDERERNVDSDKAAIDASHADIVADQAQVVSYKAKVSSAQAKVESARANLGRINSLCNFKNVKAPCAGIITARNVDAGALINEGSASNVQELLKLSRIDILRVFVQVPQNFYQTIKQGTPAAISVAEFPSKKFLASVTRVSGGLDAASRTMQVEVRIPNPNYLLKPGMYGTVDFNLTHEAATNGQQAPLMIPASSLVVKPDGLFVAAVDSKNSVHFKAISIARDFGKAIEVTGGINEGQMILLDPGIDLKEGTPVRTELSRGSNS